MHLEIETGIILSIEGPRLITHAYISRFKSVADEHIDFGRINILVGQNANGKSNIVDALYFLHDAVSEDLDTAVIKRHGIESIRQWSKTRPYHITIEVHFENSGGNGKYKFVLSSARGAYKIVEETGEWVGEDNYFGPAKGPVIRTTSFRRSENGDVEIRSSPAVPIDTPSVSLRSGELFATTLGGPFFSIHSILLKPLFDELNSFVSYSIYPNTLREPRVVSRQDVLLADGSNLPSILRLINSGYKESKESIIDSLKLIMPQVTDILVRSAGGYYVPVLQVKELNGDMHQFNMSQLSDGTLRILGLLAAFYQPNAPNIIALEEPEQMIHPGILPILSEAAKEFALSDTDMRQVFITTHSPAFLDLFEPDSIIWTRQIDGITTCGPISARQLGIIKRNLFSSGEIFLSEGFTEQ